jgi:hypothetical protein
VLVGDALSEFEVLGAPVCRRGESGPERAHVVLVEGVTRAEILGDQSNGLVADPLDVHVVIVDPGRAGNCETELVPQGPNRRDPSSAIEAVVRSLGSEQLAEVVLAAADRHDDVERAVRLVAARADGDLAELRAAVDRGLRTRRFLDYRESLAWARAGEPIVAELEAIAGLAPTRELVELLQRAVGHIVKVILRADDSSGAIGDLAQRLLDAHAGACDAGVADPVKLAAWMIRFRFKDQDFFEADPVRYASALGERGVAAYRKQVAEAGSHDSFAVRYARERLAILDKDLDAIVTILGGDLDGPYRFLRIAEAMSEIGRLDLALHWAERGIAGTQGWQVGQLFDLACRTHDQLGQPTEALRLRRAHHQRMPAISTYGALKRAAEALDVWQVEREAARAALRDADVRAFISALLDDGDDQLAWDTAALSAEDLGSDLWLRLAERREPEHPSDAVTVYVRVVDEVLEATDRRAYQQAARILKRARSAAQAAGQLDAFNGTVARLRETHRRRPTLIEILDRAKLTGDE